MREGKATEIRSADTVIHSPIAPRGSPRRRATETINREYVLFKCASCRNRWDASRAQQGALYKRLRSAKKTETKKPTKSARCGLRGLTTHRGRHVHTWYYHIYRTININITVCMCIMLIRGTSPTTNCNTRTTGPPKVKLKYYSSVILCCNTQI